MKFPRTLIRSAKDGAYAILEVLGVARMHHTLIDDGKAEPVAIGSFAIASQTANAR